MSENRQSEVRSANSRRKTRGTIPKHGRDDAVLLHVCRRFDDSLCTFVELRQAAAGEYAAPRVAARLASARRNLSALVSKLVALRATSWGGLRAKYAAWTQLEDEFGEQDTRVCMLAIELAKDTCALLGTSSSDVARNKKRARFPT